MLSFEYPSKQCSPSIYYSTFQKKKSLKGYEKFKVSRLCACTGAPSEFLTERTSLSSTSLKFFPLFLFYAEVVLEDVPAVVLSDTVEDYDLRHVHSVGFRDGGKLLRDDYRGQADVPSVEGQFDQLAGPVFHHLRRGAVV